MIANADKVTAVAAVLVTVAMRAWYYVTVTVMFDVARILGDGTFDFWKCLYDADCWIKYRVETEKVIIPIITEAFVMLQILLKFDKFGIILSYKLIILLDIR